MILAAVLAAAMILGLAACGGSQTQPDSDEEQAPVETQAPEETTAPAETQAPEETEAASVPDEADHGAQATALPFFQYNEIYAGTDSADPVYAAAYDYLSFEKTNEY